MCVDRSKIIRSMSADHTTVRLVTKPGVSMSLTLHFHPLSSFCWKALTPNSVTLGDPVPEEK
jgi:hypothetical protein